MRTNYSVLLIEQEVLFKSEEILIHDDFLPLTHVIIVMTVWHVRFFSKRIICRVTDKYLSSHKGWHARIPISWHGPHAKACNIR